jgi:hypothetical protein
VNPPIIDYRNQEIPQRRKDPDEAAFPVEWTVLLIVALTALALVATYFVLMNKLLDGVYLD